MSGPQERYKLIFRCLPSSLSTVKTALFSTGAGTYPSGLYSQCCFQTTGEGQWRAEKDANPFIGKNHAQGGDEGGGVVIERAEEVQVETICVGVACTRRAVDALKK